MTVSTSMPRATVYITNYNYGRFVKQAIESVLHQKFSSWELIIIDDGSTDGSVEIIRQFEMFPRVHVVLQENRGLVVSSNIALRLAKGEYIMRLDADDYLDENALLVLANILDTHPDVGLVYPDYYRVDEAGEILSVERRNKVGVDVTLPNMPAHGAGTMIRKRCLQELEGYSEDITCQDGYDLWIRLIEKFGVYNVNVPLFYYRQHPQSLTTNKERILHTRRLIERRFVETRKKDADFKVVAIIPVRGNTHAETGYALRRVAGRPLIDYTLDAALAFGGFRQIVVVSEDEAVLDHVKGVPCVVAVKRPSDLARPNTSIVPTVKFVLDCLGPASAADAFMMLYVNTPLRTASHIRNAIDNLLIFNSDSVISVYEDLTNHYQHAGTGLRPLFERRTLRLEKEGLWVENGAIYLAKVENLNGADYLGEKIGHTVMLKHESLQIDSEEELAVADYLLNHRSLEKETTASPSQAGV